MGVSNEWAHTYRMRGLVPSMSVVVVVVIVVLLE